MVEVYWQQDDSGMLCVSGHSAEMPIPPSVHIPPSSAETGKQSIFRRKGKVRGIVLNPDEVIAAYPQHHA